MHTSICNSNTAVVVMKDLSPEEWQAVKLATEYLDRDDMDIQEEERQVAVKLLLVVIRRGLR